MIRQPTGLDISQGQWSGGDASAISDGYARKLRNLVLEDLWVARPPFTYDNLTNIRGLALWHDNATGKRRLMSYDTSDAVRVKSASAETWASAGTTSSSASILAGHSNYRGQCILAFRDSSDVPVALYMWNGTALTPVYLSGDSANIRAIAPYAIATYRERVFFGGVFMEWQNLIGSGGLDPDLAHNAANWTRTNVTATSFTDGTATTYRITPTDTTTATLVGYDHTFIGELSDTAIVFQCQLRGVSPTYRMPITVQLKYTKEWAVGTVYAVGNVIVPTSPNGARYRCTVAGTSDAATEPVWTTVVGATFTDNTVTWMCDGSDVAAQIEGNVPSATASTEWSYFPVKAKFPFGAATYIAPVIKFGNTATPAYTLAPLDFAYKDGLTAGDPRKQSHGQQLTASFWEYPFCNLDVNSRTAVTESRSDHLYWSEVGDPETIRERNFAIVRDVPGPITAIIAAGDSLVLFKRDARQMFTSSEDANYVILPVGGALRGAGCLGARAIDISDHDGALYYVGEDGVYRWLVGSEPEELCGERMLREMFDKSTATWVESQAAPANRALLTVDQKNKRVLVYVQKGLIHCYDIRRKAWSTKDAGGDSSVTARGYQICDMLYNPGTGHVYVAFTEAATGTAGLARLDATQAAAQDQISSSGTLPVYFDVIAKPVETRPRSDVTVEELRAQLDCSVAGQSATAYYSRDQGATFTASSTTRDLNTSTPNYEPERFTIQQGWGTITPRLLVVGKAGTGALKLSGLDAMVKVNKRPEHPKRTTS